MEALAVGTLIVWWPVRTSRASGHQTATGIETGLTGSTDEAGGGENGHDEGERKTHVVRVGQLRQRVALRKRRRRESECRAPVHAQLYIYVSITML